MHRRKATGTHTNTHTTRCFTDFFVTVVPIVLNLCGQADWLLADLTILQGLRPFFMSPITSLHLIDWGEPFTQSDIN